MMGKVRMKSKHFNADGCWIDHTKGGINMSYYDYFDYYEDEYGEYAASHRSARYTTQEVEYGRETFTSRFLYE